jgi:cytochrome c-type biogenesis protein CcmH/NrfF
MRLPAIILALIFLATILPSLCLCADTKQVAESVYSEINSPFCKGKLLRDCPSTGASGLKEEIRILAVEGKTKDEIISTLYSRYGNEIRAVPSSSFIGKLAWAMPFLFMGFVLIMMGLWLKSNISRNRRN